MRVPRSAPLLLFVVLLVAASAFAGCGRFEDQSLTVTAFIGSEGAGEVVLEWAGGPRDVQLWQYQYRRPSPLRVVPWGDEWRDIPLESVRLARHRVEGLEPGRGYHFRMRPVSWSGLGAPSELASSVSSEVGIDGIVIAGHRLALERGGRFRLPTSEYWTFKVPPEGIFGAELHHFDFPGDAITELKSDAVLFLEPNTGRETGRWIPEGSRSDVGPLFDQIADSVRYRPEHPVGPLYALVGADAGVIVLEWEHHGSGVSRWQYRQRERHRIDRGEWGEWGEWSAWAEIPGSDAGARVHRLSGLLGGVSYGFELRPQPFGALVFGADASLPATDPGSFVWTSRPESGRTFKLSEDFVFDVPRGLHLRLLSFTYHPAVVPGVDVRTTVRRRATAMLDLETGSTLVVYAPTGEYLGRHVTSRGERLGVDALFDQIVASIRPAP